MSWDDIIGHDAQRDLLRGIVTRHRLAHTYLFVGTEGVGKRTIALKFAQSLLCQTYATHEFAACGTCPGCKQVLARSHPDLYIVSCPEGKREIPIELFLGPPEKRGKSGLCYDLSHTPMAGGKKVALICDAERLNEESANALLKTLEEPPPHSLIILIATHIDSILPTIRSRCQILRFNPLTDGQVSELLLKQGIVADVTAAAAAAAGSEGSLTQARILLNDELRQQRQRFFDLLAAPRFNCLAVDAFVLEAVENAGSEASAQREQAGWYFRFGVEFFKGVMNQLLTGHPSLIPQVNHFVSRLGPPTADHVTGLTYVIERLILAATHLEQNVTVPLTVESCFDDVSKSLRASLSASA